MPLGKSRIDNIIADCNPRHAFDEFGSGAMKKPYVKTAALKRQPLTAVTAVKPVSGAGN
jgi:hypothetical protein